MSNYSIDTSDNGDRSEPRDTSELPPQPVVDATGGIATFGEPDPFQQEVDPIAEFKEGIKTKFHNMWKKTFK